MSVRYFQYAQIHNPSLKNLFLFLHFSLWSTASCIQLTSGRIHISRLVFSHHPQGQLFYKFDYSKLLCSMVRPSPLLHHSPTVFFVLIPHVLHSNYQKKKIQAFPIRYQRTAICSNGKMNFLPLPPYPQVGL